MRWWLNGGSGRGGEEPSALLQSAAAAALDFVHAVGQPGEEADHLGLNHRLGAPAAVRRHLGARPFPDPEILPPGTFSRSRTTRQLGVGFTPIMELGG
jgi:hypothetical protein